MLFMKFISKYYIIHGIEFIDYFDIEYLTYFY